MIRMSESEMDNQQERLTDLVRLAMLFDTEGCISMRVAQKGKNRWGSVIPYASVVNTSDALMYWTHAAMTRLEVPHHIQHIKIYKSAGMRLPQTRITIIGFKRVQKLLPLI